MVTKFNFGDAFINVADIGSKIESWTIKESETIISDVEEVIVSEFVKDFPRIKLPEGTINEQYTLITKLVSRNSSLLEWYAAKKLVYSESKQLPKYLEGFVDPKEFNKIREQLTSISDVVKESVSKRQIASDNYKQKLKAIDAEESERIGKIVRDNQVLKILLLDSSKLPLTLSLAIENYTPVDDVDDVAQNKRLYVRETLIQYKIALLKYLKENPNADIDKIVNELGLK